MRTIVPVGPHAQHHAPRIARFDIDFKKIGDKIQFGTSTDSRVIGV